MLRWLNSNGWQKRQNMIINDTKSWWVDVFFISRDVTCVHHATEQKVAKKIDLIMWTKSLIIIIIS
jgi:hypothetical protein